MTQPPNEPTNQPPVPPGYGHLPGPPPQPGYGYPQQQGPNPYAQAPQQAPGPYAQQPQGFNPYAQQGPGGFPPAPPGAPGPQPGGKGGGRKPLVLGAAVLAGVLVLGGGGWFAYAALTEDDPKKPVAQPTADPKPAGSPTVDDGDGSGDGRKEPGLNDNRKPGEDRALWLKMNETDVPGSGATISGMWVAGDTVAKVGYKSITGYGVADGKPKWTVPLGGELCGATRKASTTGKIVVAWEKGAGSNAECNQLKQVDLKTGTVGWDQEVAKEGLFDIMTNLRMTISGDTLVIARTGPTTAVKVSDGKKLWKQEGNAQCSPYEYAGGSRLLTVTTCFKAETEQLEGVDPKTGKIQWSYKFGKTWKINRVYSVDPIIVDASSEEQSKRAVVVLNPNGTEKLRLHGQGKFAASCAWDAWGRGIEGCDGAFVDGNTFHFMTEGKTAMRNNEIVDFSLTTGKVIRRTPVPKDRFVTPLKAEGGRVYGYLDASVNGLPGGIVSWPSNGPGAMKHELRFPTPAAAVERTFYSAQFAYEDGRFFMGSTSLFGKDGAKEKLIMAFGK
ncbi:PQQ-like beta-propeller repeat protein [Streptomyces bambusae]|uniref:outer membrane protein assembly factor BamB family protein n=1 Tax=Streptomyces bambusae TaxID=1550616 RepID=UPI001CFC563C|nr:PQQ-binding-like beta-propeller repeat protein [Streptomyces bambusae]MCB5167934.1 PQQ-like beta-propeller repeat protein [Streptomyces bambusae]